MVHFIIIWPFCLKVVLRMISFGYDYHWAHRDSRFDQEVVSSLYLRFPSSSYSYAPTSFFSFRLSLEIFLLYWHYAWFLAFCLININLTMRCITVSVRQMALKIAKQLTVPHCKESRNCGFTFRICLSYSRTLVILCFLSAFLVHPFAVIMILVSFHLQLSWSCKLWFEEHKQCFSTFAYLSRTTIFPIIFKISCIILWIHPSRELSIFPFLRNFSGF